MRTGKKQFASRSSKSAKPEWVGGLHAAEAILRSTPENVTRLCFTEARQDKKLSSLMVLADSQGIAYERHAARQIEQWAGERHQGVAALAKLPGFRAESEVEGLCATDDPPLLLILDQVSDPRNFGACLRTAEACGVTAVVAPAAHSGRITPVVLKASAGAAARIPVIQVSNLARAMKNIKNLNLWLVGLGGDADEDIYQLDGRRPLAYVLGSEGRGLRRLTRENCDYYVRIPMAPAAESLNVSVAAAVCLYEVVRQRQMV